MRRVLPKFYLLFFGVCLFSASFHGTAQDVTPKDTLLVGFILKLEKTFDVKFSFVDEDLEKLRITIPNSSKLDEILTALENQTQLKIDKLNDRYHTISKSTTVDICAQLLDNYMENTIIGASIEVLDSNLATITDGDGRFSFNNIPRKAVLRIQSLGFKVKFITAESLASQKPCATIVLAQTIQQLDEVVVYKFLTSGLEKKPDASIALNTTQFGILPGLIEPDVLQTVQALPGIKSIDETVSDINVRGGTNDQNLILWDGIKMYQSGHFFGLISAFNPYLTDKVSIIKNGTSTQYGDGVSSVISIQTKDRISDTFFGGAGFNLISADVFGQLPITPNLAFQFSARRSINDFIQTPTYNRFFDRAFQDTKISEDNTTTEDLLREENFYFYDFTAKLLYDVHERHKIRLHLIVINNTLDFTQSNRDKSRIDQSNLDQENVSFGGSLASTWSNRFSTQLNVYYTDYDLDALNSSQNTQQFFQNNRVLETSAKLTTNYLISDQANWLNGYQFNEVGVTNFTNVTQPPFNSNIKGVIRTHALFSELGYTSPSKKVMARGGVRINYIENLNTFTDFIAEPRLALDYSILEHLHVAVLGELKNQTTDQIIDLEQNFLGVEKRRWILADGEALPITKSKQASLGINYDKPKLFVGLEGFYKKVNGISTSTQGFQNQDQFNGEIGDYDVKGFEFLINQKTPKMSNWLSYAYNKNTYTFADITPTRFPNNLDIRHTLTLASTYTYNKLRIGAGINYRTGKPFTKPLEGDNAINTTTFPNTINFAEPNSSRTPDYLRLDASAVYDFDLAPGIKASLGASILNILDKKNILNQFFRLDDNNQIETVRNVSLGVTPNASFRVNF